ncbi:MAG: prepilin-type N-terminal cleavage/methylation domain-containing protein [Candidatus Omnitrophica bacterium]|nr:prepilin-type N-terminal cleavage/methylation domain-containing protein [Candidatus Omnitrophota bacterium]MCM8793568.1 prepilin-type N-terminal cleavage/methylation domain-containing protein [Candidatus Omnitrophota bacterium]
MRYYLNKSVGFTLLELVMVMALMGILIFFLSGVIRKGVEAWYFVVDKEELSLQTSYALNRLVRELRTAQNIISASENYISFTDYQNNTFNYYISQEILYRNGKEILDGIIDFSLHYYPSNDNIRRITISLERSKGAYSLLLRTGVKIRKK